MIATFFPCLIAAIGWGRLSGVGFTGCCAICWCHGENHEVELGGSGAVVTLSSTPEVLDSTSFPVVFPWGLSPPLFAGGFRRARGMGGGTSGNTLNSAASSVKEGTQVVLALLSSEHKRYQCYRSIWLPDDRYCEIRNRRVGFLVWCVWFIYVEKMDIRRLFS